MPNNHDCVLVASNLVSFSEGMISGLRQDLLDCLLYAQLAADDWTCAPDRPGCSGSTGRERNHAFVMPLCY